MISRLFSIIIPVFNAEKSVHRAIASCIDQPGVEVIVVDDGSTDRSYEIASAFGNRLKSVRQSNSGVGAARNTGAGLAIGNYLAFLDADDILLPGWSEQLASLVGPEVAVVSSGVVRNDVALDERTIELPKNLGPAFQNAVAKFLAGSYAVRADIFWEAGGFDEGMYYGENTDLAFRICELAARRGLPIVPLHESLAIINFDRNPQIVQRYHQARLDAAEVQVDRHRHLLLRDPSLYADLLGVAGFSAGSLGEYRKARRHYLQAIALDRCRWKNYARFSLSLIPAARKLLW